jgi:hypothetical protein
MKCLEEVKPDFMKKYVTIKNILTITFVASLLSGIYNSIDNNQPNKGFTALGCFILAAAAIVSYTLVYVYEKDAR